MVEKKIAFENIPLSRQMVTRRVKNIVGNLEHKLQKKVENCDFFPWLWTRAVMSATQPSYTYLYVG